MGRLQPLKCGSPTLPNAVLLTMQIKFDVPAASLSIKNGVIFQIIFDRIVIMIDDVLIMF
jgi:hypothetical protein